MSNRGDRVTNEVIEMGDVIMYLYLSNYQMGNITKKGDQAFIRTNP